MKAGQKPSRLFSSLVRQRLQQGYRAWWLYDSVRNLPHVEESSLAARPKMARSLFCVYRGASFVSHRHNVDNGTVAKYARYRP